MPGSALRALQVRGRLPAAVSGGRRGFELSQGEPVAPGGCHGAAGSVWVLLEAESSGMGESPHPFFLESLGLGCRPHLLLQATGLRTGEWVFTHPRQRYFCMNYFVPSVS